MFQDDETTRKPTAAEKEQKKKLKNRARFKKWKKRSEENRRRLMEKGLMMEELELEMSDYSDGLPLLYRDTVRCCGWVEVIYSV